MKFRSQACTHRGNSGSFAAELPVILFVLLLIVIFPLLNLSIFALGSATVFACARDGAHFAARARSFSQPIPAGGETAQVIARRKARDTASNVPLLEPIGDSNIEVLIVGQPIKGRPLIRQSTPLNDISTDEYIYFVEVKVTGRVEPLIKLSPDLFGAIQGVTVPASVSATFREYCEVPTGLAQ